MTFLQNSFIYDFRSLFLTFLILKISAKKVDKNERFGYDILAK